MKRVPLASRQSRALGDEIRVGFKHQSLLQDYLELQKEFVAKKRKLLAANQKREILMAEVRFLRGRYRYLSKIQSPPPKPEPLQNPDIQSKKLPKLKNPHVNGVDVKSKKIAKTRNPSANGAVLKRPPPPAGLILGGERMGEEAVLEPPRVRGKPKNCLINDKKGKKKISWQDPVALKV